MGDDYDFTLKSVVANDKQNSFDLDIYLNPSNITIPQYNFRLGYFISDKYEISFGIDHHMKYVMKNNTPTTISGYVQNSKTIYDGIYNNTSIPLNEDFLTFEHTDGLNYINLELRRHDDIYTINANSPKLWKQVSLELISGAGGGFMIPKTNTKLLNKERYDQFQVAGYGLGVMVGLKINFLKYVFIQTELKGGYIDMFDIRTTNSTLDKASERFFFGQYNYVLGFQYNLSNK